MLRGLIFPEPPHLNPPLGRGGRKSRGVRWSGWALGIEPWDGEEYQDGLRS